MTHGSINEFPRQAEQTNKKTRDVKNPPRNGGKAPPNGSPGTVYHRGGHEGPSAEELKASNTYMAQSEQTRGTSIKSGSEVRAVRLEYCVDSAILP